MTDNKQDQKDTVEKSVVEAADDAAKKARELLKTDEPEKLEVITHNSNPKTPAEPK